MNKFDTAQSKIAEVISHSKTEEDPTHSRNALHWLLVLRPGAGEVVQLAVLAHDIERALPDRLTQGKFATYKEFKSAHAHRAGEVAAAILKDSGYSDEDSQRVFEIIKDAEFGNDDPDVNLVMDADSVSFFDNNITLYLARKGLPITQEKAVFMYNRASDRAKALIQSVMAKKPELGIKLT